MTQPAISGSTRVAAVIGSPVSHSLSPAIHNAAFAASGLDWRFLAFDVAPGGAAAALAAMRSLGIDGFAVTMPHKEAIAELVDEIEPAAAALGSVNTVVLRSDGSTFGASTDGAGFVASLADAAVVPRRVVVVGAGGAARSILDALGRCESVEDVAVINRTAATAERAAALCRVGRVGDQTDLDGADLLINTTPIGMGASAGMPIDIASLRADLAVADIVYHPLDTPLLLAARQVGAVTVDGLGMLVHQACLQQELWTGARPAAEPLRRAAEAERFASESNRSPR